MDGDEKKIKSFDDMLMKYGEFGKYQKIIYFLYSLPYVLTSMQLMGWVFVGANLPHRCLELHEDSNNAKFDSSFLDEEKLHQCKLGNQSCFNTGYVFDTSQVGDSIVKDWKLVCENSELRARLGAAPMVGYLFGGLFFGPISDKFGRKLVFLISTSLLIASSIFGAFAPTYLSFLISRTITGFAITGVEASSFVIGMELVGPSKRTLAGILCWFFESTGLLFTVALAYGFSWNWRLLQGIYAAPLLIFISYIWIAPESPRWLMSHKKYERASKIINKMIRVNGFDETKEDPVSSLKEFFESEEKAITSKHYTFVDLFRYPNLRVKTLILNVLWMVTSSMYYVLLLDQSEISANPYVGFFVTVAVQLPGYVYVIYCLEHPALGRKNSLIVMLFICGTFLSIHPFVPAHGVYRWIKISCSVMGRFAANCAYTILNLYSTEQYPTVMRGIGFTFSLTISRVGSILAPYVLLIGHLSPLVFGVGAFIGGLLTMILPETLGCHLPDTIEESEEIKPTCPCISIK